MGVFNDYPLTTLNHSIFTLLQSLFPKGLNDYQAIVNLTFLFRHKKHKNLTLQPLKVISFLNLSNLRTRINCFVLKH